MPALTARGMKEGMREEKREGKEGKGLRDPSAPHARRAALRACAARGREGIAQAQLRPRGCPEWGGASPHGRREMPSAEAGHGARHGTGIFVSLLCPFQGFEIYFFKHLFIYVHT